MPVVIDYAGVEALGRLAYQGGKVQGQAQRAAGDLAYLSQVETSRNAGAVQLQAIQAQQEESQADRALRASQGGAQQSYRYDALAQQKQLAEQQMQTTIQRAGISGQAQLAREQVQQQGRQSLSEQVHQQTLERIREEADLGKYNRAGGKPPPSIDAGGLPNDAYATREAQQFSHLGPMDPQNEAMQAGTAADDNRKTAKTISMMTTEQLRSILQGQPDDEWSSYIQRVLQNRSRDSVQSKLDGVGPEAGAGVSPWTPHESFTQGQGMGDMSGKSAAELAELANDPAKLQEWYNRNLPNPFGIDFSDPYAETN